MAIDHGAAWKGCTCNPKSSRGVKLIMKPGRCIMSLQASTRGFWMYVCEVVQLVNEASYICVDNEPPCCAPLITWKIANVIQFVLSA